jgi:hypothetical protein
MINRVKGVARIGQSSTRQSLESKINKTTDTIKHAQNDKQKSQLSIFEISLGAYTCPYSRHPHLVASRMPNAAPNDTIKIESNIVLQ